MSVEDEYNVFAEAVSVVKAEQKGIDRRITFGEKASIAGRSALLALFGAYGSSDATAAWRAYGLPAPEARD